MRLALREVLEATGGRASGTVPGDLSFDGVSTDSRRIGEGSLFVALRGPRHDGHDYVGTALASGAAAALVETGRAVPGGGNRVVEVDDTLVALGRLANRVRHRLGFPVVAITGSVGKTTTKEVTASILRAAGRRVLQTPGNLNNRIGLPLTLLGATGDEDVAVLELGISEPGEMAHLTAICEPDVAVVTAVAHVHTEGLGGLEGVAREKLKVAEGLRPGGVLVLPHGDPLLVAEPGRRTLTFGWDAGADVRAVNLELVRHLGSRFEVDGQRFDLSLHGRHNVENALAALAATRALGVPLDEAAKGMSALCPSPLRGEIRTAASGCHLLVDCYNANPKAVEAALDALAHLAGDARRVAVLGEMKELGDHSREAHGRIGKAAAEQGIRDLFLLGDETRWTREAAVAAGIEPERVRWYWDRETLAADLKAALRPGDWVLIKGSRAMGLEAIADAVCSEADAVRGE